MGINQTIKKFGQNLKRIRLLKKMSQGEICRALGVDRSYLSSLENGKRNPTLLTIEKIAKVLKTTVQKLTK